MQPSYCSLSKYIMLVSAAVLVFESCDSVNPHTLDAVHYPSPAPDTTALTFLPGIVSKDGLDFNAAFSPDGKTFFFSRSGNGKYLIMESRYDSGRWNEPIISPLFDTMYSNTDPFIAADSSLYYISRRPSPVEVPAKEYGTTKDGKQYFTQGTPITLADTTPDYDIYRMAWQNGGWAAPEWLKEINSDSTEFYVSVAKNGNIYFASYRDGNLDLYMSQKQNGKYQKPVSLGAVINSSSDEHDPLIAPDESYLIYTSSRPGGLGENDLYISYRKDGQWQAPKNMGPGINTATYEYCPNLSPDGKYFFFSSEMDVKWIDAGVLKKYQ